MKSSLILGVIGLGIAARLLHAADDDKWDLSKVDMKKAPAPAAQKGVTYEKDIRPLFEASCFRCHGEDKQKGGLRLDSKEAALKGGDDGKMIVPGDSGKSLLVAAAAQVSEEIAMPPKFKPRGGGPGGPGGPGPRAGGPGGPGGPGGRPGGPRGPGGPPAKPLTTEEVALVRAWIDQGAK